MYCSWWSLDESSSSWSVLLQSISCQFFTTYTHVNQYSVLLSARFPDNADDDADDDGDDDGDDDCDNDDVDKGNGVEGGVESLS